MTGLANIEKKPVADVVGSLKVDGDVSGREAGMKLVGAAADLNVSLRDYLRLTVQPDETQVKQELNGYEAALQYLNLPVADDFDAGIMLQAASDTFQTYPGTRAMFPEVIDDMLRWSNRQNILESTEGMVAASRQINGAEQISTVVEDDSADRDTYTVAEGANIPVRSIRTTDRTVGIFKHGSGYKTTYEFGRRARLDIMTPFANRVQRELEKSKVTALVSLLLNGDGTNAAAGETNQSSLDGTATAGTLSKVALLKWLVANAQAGTPIDTVVGNYDAYVAWLLLFAFPDSAQGPSKADQVAAGGFNLGMVPNLGGAVTFRLATSMPANKILGYTAGETAEELIEAGSQISESEQAIRNQTITYVRSESTGYKLTFGDTRSVLDFGA